MENILCNALNAWLQTETWHKNHPLDDRRFYDVVAAAWSANNSLWDESKVREMIVNIATETHGQEVKELAEQVASERVSQGTTILDYLSYRHGI